MGNPAKSLTGGMRRVRMRIGCLHDLAQKLESRILELVFLQHRLKGNVFTMVAKFAVGYIVNDTVSNRRPIRVGW